MRFLLACNHPSFALPWRTLLPYLMALHLLQPGSAQLRVVAPSLRVTANVGQDVVLRCQLSPCKDVRSSDIRWIQHRSSGLVHHYQNGVDMVQMEEYKGRTELLRDGLSDGNLDLYITAVRSSDSGSYICAVQDSVDYAEAVVNLEVSDPFSQINLSWAVALAVVVTLLVASFVVITVFLYRKKAALSRELKRKDAELAQQAAILDLTVGNLKKKAAKLVEQTKVVEKGNSELKICGGNIDLTATNLKKQAAELEKDRERMSDAKLALLATRLVKRTEELEKQTEKLVEEIKESEEQNSVLKKNCEKMDLNAAELKILVAKLVQQTEAVENRKSELKEHGKQMGEQTEALVAETEEPGKPSEELD